MDDFNSAAEGSRQAVCGKETNRAGATNEESEESGGSVEEGEMERTLIISQQPSDSDQTDFEDGGDKEDTSPKEGEDVKKKARVIDSTVAYPISEGKASSGHKEAK